VDSRDIVDSKNSTNSQLTNDDSFENRFISDEEKSMKNIYINKKRKRNNKNKKK